MLCQLEYKVQDTVLRVILRPGAKTLLLINISTIYLLDFCLEPLSGFGSLIMQPTSGAFEASIKLSNVTFRPVLLNIKLLIQCGGAIDVISFAPYNGS